MSATFKALGDALKSERRVPRYACPRNTKSHRRIATHANASMVIGRLNIYAVRARGS